MKKLLILGLLMLLPRAIAETNPKIFSFQTMSPPAGTNPEASSPTDTLNFTSGNSTVSITGNASTKTLNFESVASGVIWGAITGTLSNQTDLQSALNAKQDVLTLGNLSSPTTGVTVSNGNGSVIGSGTSVSIQNATTGQPGLLTMADWNTFNSKQAALSIGDLVTSTTGVTLSGNTGAVIGSGTTINIQTANTSRPGLLTAADWNIFNAKQNALTLGNFTSPTAGVSVSGGTGSVVGSGVAVSIQTASASQPGLLSATDWSTFNGKQNALSLGNLTSPTSGVSISGGSGAVVGAGAAVSVQTASSSQPGLLSAADWSTFNSKQAALTPGSVSTSTTGVTVGSGAASTVGPNVTVDVQTASGSQPGLLSAADWTTFNGKGNVTGPGSSIANSIPIFSNTSGQLLADSALVMTGSTTGIITTTSNVSVGMQGLGSASGNGSNIVLSTANATAGPTTAAGSIAVTQGTSNSTSVAGVGGITFTAGNNTTASTGLGGGMTFHAGTVNSTSATGGALTFVGGQNVAAGAPVTGAGPIKLFTGLTGNGILRLLIDGPGNVFVGNGSSALATSAINGFFGLPSIAGTPSGTPTLATGSTPAAYDNVHDAIVAYNGGAWKTFPANPLVSINGDTTPAQVIAAGSGISVSTTSGTTTISSSGGSVTSVGLTAPSWLTVSGSPVTSSGTLALTGTSEAQNLFLASPNGSSGAMTPRAIVAADVPTLNQNTTGTAAGLSSTLAVSSGGTGLGSLTLNNLIIGNGTSTPSFIAPGGSGNVLQSNGSIWQSAAAPFVSSALTSAHLYVGNGSNIATSVAMSGDVSISNSGATTVATVGGKTASDIASATATVDAAVANDPSPGTLMLRGDNGSGRSYVGVEIIKGAESPGNFTQIDLGAGTWAGFDTNVAVSINDHYTLVDKNGDTSIDWSSRAALDSVGSGGITWDIGEKALYNDDGFTIYDWNQNQIFSSGVSGELLTAFGYNTGVDTSVVHLASVDQGSNLLTVAPSTGAGTSPTISLGSDSTDLSGTIALTTGTLPSASAKIFTITLAHDYGAAPQSVTLFQQNPAAATAMLSIYYNKSTSSGTTIDVYSTAVALPAATALAWGYSIVE